MSGSGANLAGCASCKGRCCREYTVNVTLDDVRRLAAGMALHPREFVTLKEKEDGDFRFRPGGPLYDLRLRHRPDTQGCVFLMEIAPGHARCGAYVHRPRVCANFPTSLTGNTLSIRENTLCGDSDSWNLTAMDLPALRANIMRNRAAWGEHLRRAEQWNARVDRGHRALSEDAFYDFVLTPEQPEEKAAATAEEGAATAAGQNAAARDAAAQDAVGRGADGPAHASA
ncbi:YkgJ family cysteine cluster protein [Streptomyces diacarni]|uniref:YkgJ family cysteine cluster protein n=1 Tax=Streptomyces diacarni TaxID=2800381 RepID=UPI0015F12190|nr:YkgJ family cysteine cluster protein [Streptomyces diacarni]